MDIKEKDKKLLRAGIAMMASSICLIRMAKKIQGYLAQ